MRRPRVRNKAVSRLAWVMAAMLLFAAAAHAQLQVGDNLRIHLGGSLGLGYGGGFGNFGGSAHSISFNGNSSINGWYYHPNFLSFAIQPYYNRSQNNAASQSIFNESGVTATTNLFSGSRFPGSISFSKAFNSSGEFGLPDVAGLTTNGSGQAFSISWTALMPKLPVVSAQFSTSSNASSVLGAVGDSETSSRNFNLNSSYSISGWLLNGSYTHQSVHMSFPTFLGIAADESTGTSSSYGVSATHSLPLSGSFGAGWSRGSYSSEDGSRNHGTSENANAGASFIPVARLSLSGNVRYTGNLLEALRRSVFTEGAPALLLRDNSSRSLVFGATAAYRLGHGIGLQGYTNHREQFYRGVRISDTQYGGFFVFRYARPLFGMLYFNFGLTDTANQQGNTGLGFNGNLGMTRNFGHWETGADFSYAQNVQTLMALYTTSSYTYGGSVRRKINYQTYWNASYRGARSGLVQVAGSNNHSQTVSTGLSWKRYGVSGSYGNSAGTTVLTSSGTLTPTPLASLITEDVVLFNGSSYAVTVSAAPLRRLTLSANYASIRSQSSATSMFSLNRGERYNARMEYRLRKLQLRAGYSRAWQDIGSSHGLPSVINSYYFGLSRWFEIF